MGIYIYDSGQHIFDRAFWALWMVVKWLFKALIYFPLWFTGYMIATTVLDNNDSAFAWLGLIILFAIAFYQFIFFIKGIMIGLRANGNLIWVLLFLTCIGLTCFLQVYIIFDELRSFMGELSKENGDTLTWIFSVGLGICIYTQYHFLSDLAPAAAYPAYQLGVDISS